MSDNSDFGAFAAGFLIGGIISAATALIFAPQSGSDTRKQIVDTSLDLRDKADDSVRKIREATDENIQRLKEAADEYSGKASETFKTVKDKVTTTVDEGFKVKPKQEDIVEAE